MKRFILQALVFFILFVTVIIAATGTVNTIINKGDYFRIEANANTVIIGHSHPECAYNDTLIDGIKNYAQSGESYFYTYYKIKKIIEGNSQLKTVFIEFTNNQINTEIDKWIWGNAYVSLRYPKFAAFMSIRDWALLFTHNPKAVLNASSITLKNNFQFLYTRKNNFIMESKWGGYNRLDHVITNNQVIEAKKINKLQIETANKISKKNVYYLSKIVELCKSKSIQIYLIRSPVHPACTGMGNELVFKKILATEFPDIEFLDFKDFSERDSYFADLEHLNYEGAKQYSLFFNHLLQTGLLKHVNKQAVINTAIEVRKLSTEKF